MNIVAFDLGRNFAWAISYNQRRYVWGHKQLNELRAHRLGEFMRFLMTQAWLKKMDAVVFETPFARGRAATRSLWGQAGVLEACVSELNLPVVDVAVPTIKKYACGYGKAAKNDMIAAAQRMGYTGTNDNEADAFCLMKYAELNLERGVPT